MIAKERFLKLGYNQIIYGNDIQYIKKDDESEMERVHMIRIKYIEFYNLSKEILIKTIFKWKDGSETENDSEVLSINEFNAIQTQINELNWNEEC